MTTQEEIDEMFASLLESISQICNKTTYANLSRNVEIIKGEYRDMLQFCKNHSKSLWHSVKDGDLPQGAKDDAIDPPFLVKTSGGDIYTAYYGLREEDKEMCFFDDCGLALGVEYWMEIPELPT